MISEQKNDTQKTRLYEFYQKLKQKRKEERRNNDWRHATPNISKGSTFYKELFKLRSQRENSNSSNNLSAYETLKTEYQPAVSDYSHTQLPKDDTLMQHLLMMNNQNQMSPKSKIPHLLGREPLKKRKDTFMICRDAIAPNLNQLMGQLLQQSEDGSTQSLLEKHK